MIRKYLCIFTSVCFLILPATSHALIQHAFTVSDYIDYWSGPTYHAGEGGTREGFSTGDSWLGTNTTAIVPHLHAGTGAPSYDPSLNRLYFDVNSPVVPFVSSGWYQQPFITIAEYNVEGSFNWSRKSQFSNFTLEMQGLASGWEGGSWSGWKTLWSVRPGSSGLSGAVNFAFRGCGTRFVLTAGDLVPEPSSIIAMLSGLAGIGGIAIAKKPR